MPILKVFAPRAAWAQTAKGLPGAWRLVATYPAFVVVEAQATTALALATRLPTEDITEQYRLPGDVGVAPSRGTHHHLVQFIGPVKQAWLKAVAACGATLRESLGDFSYVVKANAATMRKVAALDFVRTSGHWPHPARVSPTLQAECAHDNGTTPHLHALTLEVFDAKDLPAVAQAVRAMGLTVEAAAPGARTLTLQVPFPGPRPLAQIIQSLSAIHGVRWVREKVLARKRNDVARRLMGTHHTVSAPRGMQLTGLGEVIGVCDTGLDGGRVDDMHPDFAGRVKFIKSYPIAAHWAPWVHNVGDDDGAADVDSGHGTHVAGSVLGNGAASRGRALRGLAHEAQLVFQAVEQRVQWKPHIPSPDRDQPYALAGIPDDLETLLHDAYRQGARIHSNSWGGGAPGEYDDQCRRLDDYVWRHKSFCVLVAAGNDGSDGNADGRIDATSVESPGTAKNCITVGASESQRAAFGDTTYGAWWPNSFPVAPFRRDALADNPRQVVAFSSRGPTADQRPKPDVVAPGTFILSTRSRRLPEGSTGWAPHANNPLYFHLGGTSMATPLAAGAVALLRQALRQHHGIKQPSAALLKALLMAGAKRLPSSASVGGADALIDNEQGAGLINLDRSLQRVLVAAHGRGLRTGQLSTRRFEVPDSAKHKTIRVVMAYSDAPGERLVNNLNLLVQDPAETRHLGRGSGAPPSDADAGVMVLDQTHNVEIVQARAKPGTWTLTVAASNVPEGPQDFALAVVLV